MELVKRVSQSSLRRISDFWKTQKIFGMVKVSHNICVENIENEIDRTRTLSKSKNRIVLYCKSGIRSASAGQILVKNSFANVYSLVNGIESTT